MNLFKNMYLNFMCSAVQCPDKHVYYGHIKYYTKIVVVLGNQQVSVKYIVKCSVKVGTPENVYLYLESSS